MGVTIYTDGAAKGNPGKGGYGVVLLSGKHRKEISQGFKLTTNNRMELLAVIIGLESLKKNNETVVVYSDSKYVVDAVEKKWVFSWEKTNFNKFLKPIKAAGTSTLTCYLIPYLLYPILVLMNFSWPEWMIVGNVGLVKSLLFSFSIIVFVRILEKNNLKLKV